MRCFRLAESESLRIEGDVPEVPSVAHYASGVQPPPPSLLSMWDDICVYGNEVLDAMNELRNGLSPMHVSLYFLGIRSYVLNRRMGVVSCARSWNWKVNSFDKEK